MDANEIRRLYFEDPYRVQFRADVVERSLVEGRPALVLSQTCFYPESGGQPSDKGTIEGVAVLKILEEGEKIVHVLETDVAAPQITGTIDWAVRFDHMQQHSGQHILSQAFYEIVKGETLSFHLGAEVSTVEIGVIKIHDDEFNRIERRANEIIFEDREIKTYFVAREKIGSIPLRKPPKKEGLIRVVEVDGFDYSACGGTHCRRTGEVGLIKMTQWERIRNNLRFEFVCGWRALSDYRQKNAIVRQLSNQFSMKEADVPSSVRKLAEDLKSVRKLARKSEEKLAEFEALEFMKKAQGRVIKDVFTEKTPEAAKFLALNIIKQGDYIVLFGAKSEARSHLILAASENLKLDMRLLVPIVVPLINGKGGGSASLVEIAGEPDADLAAILLKVEDNIKHS
jgi:alanyl-tRNA synthetase